MICKEVDYEGAIQQWKQLLDGKGLSAAQQREARWQMAGLRAEKDMAYHLKVFFADRGAFAVFNNLKVEHNGLTAQIDHLVLTRWTAYFIESKSVSQVIAVNEHGEWERVHNRRHIPIESPLEQSRRHKETLYGLMNEHRTEFMTGYLGIKQANQFAGALTPVHYVAVSTVPSAGSLSTSRLRSVRLTCAQTFIVRSIWIISASRRLFRGDHNALSFERGVIS